MVNEVCVLYSCLTSPGPFLFLLGVVVVVRERYREKTDWSPRDCGPHPHIRSYSSYQKLNSLLTIIFFSLSLFVCIFSCNLVCPSFEFVSFNLKYTWLLLGLVWVVYYYA